MLFLKMLPITDDFGYSVDKKKAADTRYNFCFNNKFRFCFSILILVLPIHEPNRCHHR